MANHIYNVTTLRGEEFITESDQMRANKIRVMQVAGKLENRLILGTVAKNHQNITCMAT